MNTMHQKPSKTKIVCTRGTSAVCITDSLTRHERVDSLTGEQTNFLTGERVDFLMGERVDSSTSSRDMEHFMEELSNDDKTDASVESYLWPSLRGFTSREDVDWISLE